MLTWKFTSPAPVLAVNVPGHGQVRFVEGRYETGDFVIADALTQISKRSHLVNLADPEPPAPEPVAETETARATRWYRKG